MPLVALTLDTPCYLISGLASDLTVQVRIDDKLIPLSTTQFTLVEGQCTDILVTTQEYFATASATFPSNAWGVVQQVTEIDGLTVAVSAGGKSISATFYCALRKTLHFRPVRNPFFTTTINFSKIRFPWVWSVSHCCKV
jgi:hypothetical protein